MATATAPDIKTMHTLPGDAVRQIQWRFADRYDLQILVQSSRAVARGTVARMVAAGERNTHEWTPAKREMMEAFDRAGITAAFMEPEEGVVLTVVADETEADIVCGLLRSAGIACGYRDTEAIDSPLEDFTAAGRQEILVRPADLEAARELLAAPTGD